MELDEAIAVTIDVLLRGGAASYGYDLYPPQVVRTYLEWQRQIPHHEREPIVRKMAPLSWMRRGNCVGGDWSGRASRISESRQ
jgi:hypothetical protein